MLDKNIYIKETICAAGNKRAKAVSQKQKCNVQVYNTTDESPAGSVNQKPKTQTKDEEESESLSLNDESESLSLNDESESLSLNDESETETESQPGAKKVTKADILQQKDYVCKLIL